MQRRAAAAYVGLFLVIAAGAYAVIATAQAPAISIDSPDYELTQGDQLTVNGRTYNVTAVTAEISGGGGGHGGGGGSLVHEAKLVWTDPDGAYVKSWRAGKEAEFENATLNGTELNGKYTVVVANESGVSSATLREVPGDDVTTKQVDNETYVLEDEDGDGKSDPGEDLLPITSYEPLQRVRVEEGVVDFSGNATTVNVTRNRVRFNWTAPKSMPTTVSQAGNVSLGVNDSQASYLAYFPNNSTVQLKQNPEGYETYHQQSKTQSYFHERENGLWGIAILSMLTAIFMIGLAFLPRKEMD